MNFQQTARLRHPLWMEYLNDAAKHWSALAGQGEYNGWIYGGDNAAIRQREQDMVDRFRRTFFPELP